MRARNVIAGLALAVLCGGLIALPPGCSATLLLNQTAERSGNVTVVLINDTPYRASFSYGAWDAWQRNPPGPIEFRQLRLEGQDTAGPTSLNCARNFAIGTQDFYDRAAYHKVGDSANFDADAFDIVVHFSDAPADSNLAATATVGTALGQEWLLGVDYSCGDELVFTFVQDPDAEGGFRIDFAVLVAEGN